MKMKGPYLYSRYPSRPRRELWSYAFPNEHWIQLARIACHPLAPSSEHDDASYSHVDGLALTAKNLRAAAKAPQS